MNLARARWRFFRNASGLTWVRVISPSFVGDLVDRRLGKVAPQLQDGGVAVLGSGSPDRFPGGTRRG